MTDHFALLNQPRRPWLDPDKLKQAFHSQSLRAHPDTHAQAGSPIEAEAAFARLNEAYQVLQEPKSRLHHLLSLEGSSPPAPRADSIPPGVEELFPVVATVLQDADSVLQKASRSSNALSRSLLKTEVLQSEQRIGQALEGLLDLERKAIAQLQQINEAWEREDGNHLSELRGLYLQFSYLTRWTSELREKQMQLSSL
jgi:curved DNA-binding protein CbpA